MRLILMCGISGSGKSALAQKLWAEDPLNRIIVNRDTIRLSFGDPETYYSSPYLNKMEKEVTFIQDTLIYNALSQGKTVIVDNTHLKNSYIQDYTIWNVPIETIKVEEDLKTCIERDKNRSRTVGEDIIKRQFNQLKSLNIDYDSLLPITLENNEELPPVILFDIDGTLAIMKDREAFEFHKVGQDDPCPVVGTIFSNFPQENIIVCSGREETCRKETEEWFLKHFDIVPEIKMRKKGDYRKDWIVKTEMWQEIVKENHIFAIYDDRDQVVRRARMLGLKVFQVNNGYF